MAAARSCRGRRGGAHASAAAGHDAAPLRGAAGAAAGAARTRSARVWVYGRRVDRDAGGGGDRAHRWRALLTRSRQSHPARVWLEPPAADHTRDAARRGSTAALAGGALADAQQRADEEGATIVWGDESGFSLLPLAVRTWAPRGATPILRVPLTREHLWVISAITRRDACSGQVRTDNYDGEAVVGFLRVLLRKLAGKALVIWDGSPIHHGQAVKDFLSAGAARRLQLERLPGYAPDLHPGTPMRASGTPSSASNWALSAPPLWRTCVTACGAPRSACATSPTSSAPAHDSADTCFSS
jgi:DDE superfamily endonuclease